MPTRPCGRASSCVRMRCPDKLGFLSAILAIGAALPLLGCAREQQTRVTLVVRTDLAVQGEQPTRMIRELLPAIYLVSVRELGIDARVSVTAGTMRSELRDYVPRHGLHATAIRLTT